MSLSLIAFVMMAMTSMFFLAALLIGERMFELSAVRQTGDSSLGHRSVNWLGGLALVMAVLICLA